MKHHLNAGDTVPYTKGQSHSQWWWWWHETEGIHYTAVWTASLAGVHLASWKLTELNWPLFGPRGPRQSPVDQGKLVLTEFSQLLFSTSLNILFKQICMKQPVNNYQRLLILSNRRTSPAQLLCNASTDFCLHTALTRLLHYTLKF